LRPLSIETTGSSRKLVTGKKIEEALQLDSGELRGKILLSKSAILAVAGDTAGVAEALIEAGLLIDEEREPRDALVLRFNLLAALCDLNRAEEAQQRLPQVRRLAEKLGGAWDLTRVVWLEAKTYAALGHPDEAWTRFEQVRREFVRESMAFDYALVSVELSLVLLRQGRTAEVRAIVEEMYWIFKSQEVKHEPLAALEIFCEAARREAATVDLTRRVLHYLHRAQYDPERPFDEEAGVK